MNEYTNTLKDGLFSGHSASEGDTWTKPQYVNSGGSSAAYSFEYNQDSDLTEPRGLLSNCPDDQKTYVHRKLEKVFANCSKSVAEKMTKAVDYFLDPENCNKTHLTTKFDCETIDVNDPDRSDGPLVQQDVVMPPYLTLQKRIAFTARIEGSPIAGLARFITCSSGMFWLTFVEVRNVIDQGFSIDTLSAYLANLSDEFLGKLPSIIIDEGSSAFCPEGYVCIAIALGDEKCADEKMHSFITHPVLDKRMASGRIDAVSLTEIKSWVSKGIARKLKVLTYDGYAKGLKAYVNALGGT